MDLRRFVSCQQCIIRVLWYPGAYRLVTNLLTLYMSYTALQTCLNHGRRDQVEPYDWSSLFDPFDVKVRDAKQPVHIFGHGVF